MSLEKYLKYKNKYLTLKNMQLHGGAPPGASPELMKVTSNLRTVHKSIELLKYLYENDFDFNKLNYPKYTDIDTYYDRKYLKMNNVREINVDLIMPYRAILDTNTLLPDNEKFITKKQHASFLSGLEESKADYDSIIVSLPIVNEQRLVFSGYLNTSVAWLIKKIGEFINFLKQKIKDKKIDINKLLETLGSLETIIHIEKEKLQPPLQKQRKQQKQKSHQSQQKSQKSQQPQQSQQSPTQEPPKQEPPKQDSPKQEGPTQEPPKQDSTKQKSQQAPKQESSKQEGATQEPPKQDSSKKDSSKQKSQESAKQKSQKSQESAKQESPKQPKQKSQQAPAQQPRQGSSKK